MTKSSYDSFAGILRKTLNWPTVADMLKVETACMVYKSINDFAPDYLSEIFTKYSAWSKKNLRNTATDLQVPLNENVQWPTSFFISWCWCLETLRFGSQAGILFQSI